MPISCLQWEHRLPLILQEVREANADIICLQELNHFGKQGAIKQQLLRTEQHCELWQRHHPPAKKVPCSHVIMHVLPNTVKLRRLMVFLCDVLRCVVCLQMRWQLLWCLRVTPASSGLSSLRQHSSLASLQMASHCFTGIAASPATQHLKVGHRRSASGRVVRQLLTAGNKHQAVLDACCNTRAVLVAEQC